ncbi:MAG: IS30 family transposase [Lachnospiraceae bacterium]|nr:IS30 family transposase [Lachnospiraceae bacterium]
MAKREIRTYRHLTYTDRLNIEKWLKKGLSKQEIADKLRVSLQTVYRELKRGEYEKLDGATWEMETAYSPDIAEEKYQKNLREKGPDFKIGSNQELADFLEKTIIEKDYSPAAALAEAKAAGYEVNISIPTLYSYIEKGLFVNLTAKQLPRGGKKKQRYKTVQKKKASRAPAGESIEKRPEDVKERKEFGHWEGDTVYSGKGKKKSKAGLLTITERKTRKEIIIKIPNRKAETVVKAVDALERRWGAVNFREVFKSITFDNGTEFAAADELEASCINKTIPRTKVYFAHPYSSFERGTNEVQNGMIRRKHPKGTDFETVSKQELQDTEDWMNDYPRKILGYQSSNAAFNEELRKLGIAAA